MLAYGYTHPFKRSIMDLRIKQWQSLTLPPTHNAVTSLTVSHGLIQIVDAVKNPILGMSKAGSSGQAIIETFRMSRMTVWRDRTKGQGWKVTKVTPHNVAAMEIHEENGQVDESE